MSTQTKRPFTEAKKQADHIIATIAPFCDRIEVAGSLRRQRPAVGDIEIVALPARQSDLFGNPLPNEPTQLDSFLEEKGVTFDKNGRKYKKFKYGRGWVDLFLPASPAHWGSILTIRTGSREFNLWLVKQAGSAQLRFKEGLLWTWDWKLVETAEEVDLFEAIGLPFIHPTMRDDGRWLEAVEK